MDAGMYGMNLKSIAYRTVYQRLAKITISSAILFTATATYAIPLPEKSPRFPNDPVPTYPGKAPPPVGIPLPGQQQPQERDDRVSTILEDYGGNLWVGTWQGLTQIDPNTSPSAHSQSPNRSLSPR